MKTAEDLQTQQLAQRLRMAQQRTEHIFSMVHPDAYYEKPIPLRHPIVFYEGHLPAFIWNTLFRNILGADSFDPQLDLLFARGIDPSDLTTADALNQKTWPDREAVQRYKNGIHQRFYAFLESGDSVPHTAVIFLLLEHELMHQETLMYILHQLPHHLKQRPDDIKPLSTGTAPLPVMREISEGTAILGAMPGEFPFVWDNEIPVQNVTVPAFAMDAYNITNGQFLEFMAAGGYETRAFWEQETWDWRSENNITHPFFWRKQDDTWILRDFFEDIPLPHDWPVYVTHAEARAYARYAGKELPTEAEWHRAAYGDNLDQPCDTGNVNFERYSPVPVGSFPQNASPYGIYDLIGNGWEWTSTPFMPFPGFEASEAYPQYSADFFDGNHFVIKGGSPFTDARLLRRSFRNWFYWHYPYMYATFRCVTH